MRLSSLSNPVVISSLLHGWPVEATSAYLGIESRINCYPNFTPDIDLDRDYRFNRINHNGIPSGIATKTPTLSGRYGFKITVPR